MKIAEHGFFALDALPHDTTSGRARDCGGAARQPLTSGGSAARVPARRSMKRSGMMATQTRDRLRALNLDRSRISVHHSLRCPLHRIRDTEWDKPRSSLAHQTYSDQRLAKIELGRAGTMPVGFTLRWLP